MEEKQYLTKEKHDELKAELAKLISQDRMEVAQDLSYAASLGDRSENGEYHQARERQAQLEERIAKLESILKSAAIVSDRHSDIIGVGSTVVIQKKGQKDKKEYQIVGSEEADMPSGRISHNSPLGLALMGKKKSDEVSFSAPNGEMSYQVLEVK